MTDFPHIPDEVLIRHTCHCDTATNRPHDDEPEIHRFEVDGEPFPWYISEKGPQVTRLADDFWRIDIEILGLARIVTEAMLPIGSSGRMGEIPVIGGIAFPWLMTEEGWSMTAGHKQIPTVTLGFLARNVDTNTPVTDLREQWADRAIWANGGDCWKPGKDRCFACDTWVDDLYEHIPQAHPEHVSDRGIRVS